MAKGAYIGINGIARKIKKGYIGVNGVARKIKKAYIGVGGVARPCWGGGEPVFYGGITALSNGRQRVPSANVGDYLVFGGGYKSSAVNTVDAYNSSLVRSTPTALPNVTDKHASTSIGNYALFGGGQGRSTSTIYKTLVTYNPSLTQSTADDLNSAAYSLVATSIGSYALFGGGRLSIITGNPKITAYNASLTKSTPTNLSTPKRTETTATHNGKYALFGGGSTAVATVEAYNTSLTLSTAPNLSVGRGYMTAGQVGKYALFVWGYNASTTDNYTNIDCYDESLTRTTVYSKYEGSYLPTPTATLGDYCILHASYQNVEYIDSSLTIQDIDASASDVLHDAVLAGGGGTVGNYAIFVGSNYDDYMTKADAYTL